MPLLKVFISRCLLFYIVYFAMVSFTDLVLGTYLAAPAVAAAAAAGIPGTSHTERRATAKYEPNFRISPLDGSKIALPTKEQLAWQDQEIGVIIHYELATYLNIDGCNRVPDLVPDINLWKPDQLDMDQWLDSIEALGAKYGTLVAKHNCGFALWPSKTQFPYKDGTENNPYNYTVADAPDKTDLVRAFVDAAKKRDIGTGFYYSVNVNNFLNVQNSVVRPNETLAEGQVRVTNETFGDIVNSQLEELWSEYGDLTEVSFFFFSFYEFFCLEIDILTRVCVDLVRWRIHVGADGGHPDALGSPPAAGCALWRVLYGRQLSSQLGYEQLFFVLVPTW